MDQDREYTPTDPLETLRRDKVLQDDLVDFSQTFNDGERAEKRVLLNERLDAALASGSWVELHEQIQARDTARATEPLSPLAIPTPSKSEKTWVDKKTLIDGNEKARYVMRKSPFNEGGMADIYFCYDRLLERPCALKVINEFLTNTSFENVFEVEGKTQARTEGISTIQVYDHLYLDDDKEGILMEYLDPRTTPTLFDLEKKPEVFFPDGFSVEQRVQVIEELADIIEALLKRGLQHNDIKPKNIFINTKTKPGQPSVILSDFGLSNWVALSLPQEESVFGTPSYLSPERIVGEKVTEDFSNEETLQSEVFILGIIAFELLCGKLPFEGDDYPEIMIATIQTEWTSEAIVKLLEESPITSELPSEHKTHMAEALAMALSKNPDDRFRSPHAFAFALKSSLPTRISVTPTSVSTKDKQGSVPDTKNVLTSKVIRFITSRLRDIPSSH